MNTIDQRLPTLQESNPYLAQKTKQSELTVMSKQ